jgi:hypothetical protein
VVSGKTSSSHVAAAAAASLRHHNNHNNSQNSSRMLLASNRTTTTTPSSVNHQPRLMANNTSSTNLLKSVKPGLAAVSTAQPTITPSASSSTVIQGSKIPRPSCSLSNVGCSSGGSQKAARQLQRHDSTPTPLAHLLFLLLWGLFIVIHRLHLYYYRPAAGLGGSNLLYTSRRVVYTSRTTTKVVNLLSSGLT